MKKVQQFINEPFAKSAANFMKYICYFVIFFFVIGLVCSFMGRQTFILHTSSGTYNKAIYSDENYN